MPSSQANAFDMFIAAFGRPPTHSETTWLIHFDHQIRTGEMPMSEVGRVFGLNPKVQVNEMLTPLPEPAGGHPNPYYRPAPPEDRFPAHEAANIEKLREASQQILQRDLDLHTLYEMLKLLYAVPDDLPEAEHEAYLRKKEMDVAEIVVRVALGEDGLANDWALLATQSNVAIDRLMAMDWTRQVELVGTMEIPRTQVVNPHEEPDAALMFSDQSWAFFSSVWNKLRDQGRAELEDISIAQARQIAPLIDEFDRELSYELRDTVGNLLAHPQLVEGAESYSLAEPTNAFSAVRANEVTEAIAELVSGAANRDEYEIIVAEPLSAIQDLPSHVSILMDGYRLTDGEGAFRNLPLSMALDRDDLAILEGAVNRDAYHYSVQGRLDALRDASDVLRDVDGYRLIDPEDAFLGMPVGFLDEDHVALIREAENAGSYRLVIHDTVDNLLAADDSYLGLFDAYLVSSPEGIAFTIADITPDLVAVLGDAGNADAVSLVVADSIENIMGASEDVLALVESYTITNEPSDFVDLGVMEFLAYQPWMQRAANAAELEGSIRDAAEQIKSLITFPDRALVDDHLSHITHEEMGGRSFSVLGVEDRFEFAEADFGEAPTSIIDFELTGDVQDRLSVANSLLDSPSARVNVWTAVPDAIAADPREGSLIIVDQSLLQGRDLETLISEEAGGPLVFGPADGTASPVIFATEDAGDAVFWLWQDQDAGSGFDGQVQNVELTPFVRLVGVDNEALTQHFTTDNLM